jgi:WD40 repeat protein
MIHGENVIWENEVMKRYIGVLCIGLAAISVSNAREPDLRRTLVENNDFCFSAMAISPDNRTLASAGWDVARDVGVVTLWDVSTGKNVGLSYKFGHLCDCLVFTPDGRTLAGGISSRVVQLWDVTTHKATYTLTLGTYSGLAHSYSSVAFRPSGRILLAWNGGDSHGTGEAVTFWNMTTVQKVSDVRMKTGGCVRVVFNADCTSVAVSGVLGDDRLEIYDTASGKQTATFATGRSEYQTSFATFSRSGKTLASAAHDSVDLWDVATGKKISTLRDPMTHEGSSEAVCHLAFSPDGKNLAAGMLSVSEVVLWDVDKKTIAGRIKGRAHVKDRPWKGEGILGVEFSANGKMLAAGRRDGTIELWDIDSVREEAPYPTIMPSRNDEIYKSCGEGKRGHVPRSHGG